MLPVKGVLALMALRGSSRSSRVALRALALALEFYLPVLGSIGDAYHHRDLLNHHHLPGDCCSVRMGWLRLPCCLESGS